MIQKIFKWRTQVFCQVFWIPIIMDEIKSIQLWWNFRTPKTRRRPLVPKEKQQVSYKGSRMRLILVFWPAVLETKRWWREVFKILRENDFPCRILYLTKLSITCEVRRKRCQTYEISKILPLTIEGSAIKMRTSTKRATDSKKQGSQQNREWRLPGSGEEKSQASSCATAQSSTSPG